MSEAIDACAREVASIILRNDEDTIGVIATNKRNAKRIQQRAKDLCSEHDAVFTVDNPDALETVSVKPKFFTRSEMRGMGAFDYLLVMIDNIETGMMLFNHCLFALKFEDTFVEVFDSTKK